MFIPLWVVIGVAVAVFVLVERQLTERMRRNARELLERATPDDETWAELAERERASTDLRPRPAPSSSRRDSRGPAGA